jgi:glycosyltransferase involved in cell wall biosynthesis
MLYHEEAWKGVADGIEALIQARRAFPKLQAILFGVYPKPEGLPDWIEYRRDPPQEELVASIYNGSSIYVCPSWAEGFGLPPAEAMACGCAIAVTDSGGVRDFAEDGVTALISPPKDPEALAANLMSLLTNDELRTRLARGGHDRIQQFTWERSTDLMERCLAEPASRSTRRD